MGQTKTFLENQTNGKEIAKRIFHFISTINSNPCAFEKRCNISNGYFSKLSNKGNSIGSRILIKMKIQYNNININWIITGEGEMED